MTWRIGATGLVALCTYALLACSSSPSSPEGGAGTGGGDEPGAGGSVGTAGTNANGGTTTNPPLAGTGGSAQGGSDTGQAGTGGSATPMGGSGGSAPVDPEGPVPCQRTTPVNGSGELGPAIEAAQPGDCLELADGNYTFPTITKVGTAEAPIVIRAANRHGAVVNEGAILLLNSEHVILEGLDVTTSGEASDLPNGGTNGLLISFTDSEYCRLTRSLIHPQGPPSDRDWIVITGETCGNNRIDHNDIGPQNTIANMLMIDGSGNEEPLIPGNVCQHNRVDHNYFHDINYGGGNNWEAIRVGRSWQGPSDGFNIIERNLLVSADGDPEVVSIKSSSNIVRYNTMRDTNGEFTLRHGNRTQVYGNYILDSGGIRVYGADHRIFNNYIDGGDIWLDDGSEPETDEPGKAHYQVHRAWVFNNTLIGNGIRVGGSKAYAPADCRLANNLVTGGNIGGGAMSEGNLVGGANPLTMQDGIYRLMPGGDADRVIGQAVNTEFYELMLDIDGQVRTEPDVGADELSDEPVTIPGPLTPDDVGPDAP